MDLSPDAIDECLDHWPVARLATVGDDRRPHQVPIVFVRSGARLWSPVDGKPKRGGELVRVHNMRARPEVSLLLDHYDADWTRLWWIRIEATAEVIQPASSADPQVSAALIDLEAKYPQYASVPLLGPEATLLAFDIGRIVSWTAGA